MEKVNNTVKAYARIITFLVLWGILLLTSGLFKSFDILKALGQIPQAVTIYIFIGLVFRKWIWRWSFLQGWLIKIPNIQGTWRGTLQSDWINPDSGQGIAPIPVVLVIRQTFSTIKCTLMTQESSSYSTTADINYMHSGDDLYLTYNYTNRPKATFMHRSEIHDGAASLKIITKPTRCFEGIYWTSRKTRGDIALQFESKKLVEKF